MSRKGRLLRRVVIVLAVLLAGSVITYLSGIAFIGHALTRADPYPAFMADYELRRTGSYEVAERAFSDFIASTFPVGSDADGAIAQMTGGGFEVVTSTPESAELVWKRRAGPCSEVYSIVVRKDADRRITKIDGRLQPICL